MNKRNIVGELVAMIVMSAALVACGGNAQDAQSAKAVARMALKQGSVQPAANVQEVGDTLQVHGYFTNYQIVHNANGTTALTNTVDGTSTTYASTLKTIKFADRFVSFDLEGVPGQAYRLYQAAFNRKPDLPGLGFWTMAMQNGALLNDVAAGFTGSSEFQKTYGAVSDSQFVTLLYNNVLHRAPEQAGYDFWVNGIKNGASRESVLVQFSESAENKNNVAMNISNGIVYVPDSSVLKVIPVQASSYLNAKNIALPPQVMPSQHNANPVKFITSTEQITAGYAFGDFFQDGSYSMVGFSNNFVPSTDANYGRTPGHAYFYKKDVNGNWVDHTSDLLADQTGCISPRKVIVADFNGDGVPDVFVACHGTDVYPLPPGYAFGEVPRILLSQSNGTYKNVAAPINCYCHGAAAADVNGNGYSDIVVADAQVRGQPFYLVNNKDGTFTPDYTRMPVSTEPNNLTCNPACNLGIWSVELVDFDNSGKFDLWLGGSDDHSLGGFPSAIYHNPGTNNFRTATATVLPASNIVADDNPLDMIYLNGYIYQMRVDRAYSETSIQKIDYKTLASTNIYQAGKIAGTPYTWFIWMIPYQGNIHSADSSYGVSVQQ